MRTPFLALGGFALAVACAAGLGVASNVGDDEWEGSVAPPERRLDAFRMTVDGEVFEVWTPEGHPNQRNFDWLTGPNEGYGYGSSGPSSAAWTKAELEEDIRTFLSMIDPETGYVADD